LNTLICLNNKCRHLKKERCKFKTTAEKLLDKNAKKKGIGGYVEEDKK
jgi:hypothetical protein